jgi:ribosomal protein S18 acetylase RimI-like enzyme
MQLVEMTIGDYDAIMRLMTRTSGIVIRVVDSRENVEKFLLRNPGLSFVAWEGEVMVGCAMCGHDGRRGYLHHVVVEPTFRGQGIAHQLITRCLDRLESEGIFKTHIDVLTTNGVANNYWVKRGWQRRTDIHRYSYNRSADANA